MPRAVSNLLGLAVLSYLTERPMHAYELNRTLKDRDAARTFKLSYGALYGVVRQLDR
jgi:DNA-binding PadR family transcriptional regulator